MNRSTSTLGCLAVLSMVLCQANEETKSSVKDATKERDVTMFEVKFRLKGDISDGNQGLKLHIGSDLKFHAGRGVFLEGQSLAEALKGYKTSEKRIVTLYVSEPEKINLSKFFGILNQLKEKSDKTKKTLVFVNLIGK